MKTPIAVLFFFGLSLLFSRTDAFAATWIHTLTFDPPQNIVDTTSGNQANFQYSHDLGSFPSGEYTLLFGSLRLTHSGNSALGPTQELWAIYSGSTWVGDLGSSEDTPLTDLWVLPDSLLQTIAAAPAGIFESALWELTPYNSERLDLLRSELTLEYRSRSTAPLSTPSVPEPGTAFLLFSGFALAGLFNGVFRKAVRAK